MYSFAEWLYGTPASQFLQTNLWTVPTIQSIHILAIGIVAGSIFMIGMRVLGLMWVDEPLKAAVERFSPWMWGALLVLLLSGLTLIVAEPIRELTAFSFWMKMILLAIGVTIAIVFQRSVSRNAERWESSASQPQLRALAILTLAVWAGVIFLGRFIAWDAEIWGPLSPQFML